MNKVEEARERTRLRVDFANTITLDDHIRIVRLYAPDYILPLGNPVAMESFQALIDGYGAGLYLTFGLRFTDATLAAIKRGHLQRARRSWSGKRLSDLNLAVPT